MARQSSSESPPRRGLSPPPLALSAPGAPIGAVDVDTEATEPADAGPVRPNAPPGEGDVRVAPSHQPKAASTSRRPKRGTWGSIKSSLGGSP